MNIRHLSIRTALRAGESCAVLAQDQDNAVRFQDWKMVASLAELADWQGCRIYNRIYVEPSPE